MLSQTQNGSILGTVRDPTRSGVPNASVTLKSERDGSQRTVVTGDDGGYRFNIVPLGSYTVTISAPGFKQFVNREVALETNQTLRLDADLEIGQTSEQITVEAQTATITTDTASISPSRGQEEINRSPNGVNVPTVITASKSISSTEGTFSFYGSGQSQVKTTKDGVEYGYWNHYVYGYTVQEVKTEALLAPAKFQTPVTINLVTKQGGNEPHGKFEMTLQNGILNATQNPRTHADQCSTARPCTGTWTGGLSLTGPVYLPKIYDGRNRTFWTFAMTDQKNASSRRPITNSVPTTTARSGNLTGLPGTAIDPTTGQAFPGNTIPSGRINPVTQKLLALYPQPDVAGGTVASAISQIPNNWLRTFAARVDQKITDRNMLNFSWSKYGQVFEYDFADRSVAGYMGNALGQWRTNVWTVGDTHTFSPTIVNEMRFGVNTEGPTGYSVSQDAAQRIQQLGLTNIPAPRASATVAGPDITVSGFTPFLGWSVSDNNDHVYQFSDNIAIQRGRHTIQTGGDYKYSAIDHLSASSGIYPQYAFDGRITGVAFADFLLGIPGTVTRTNSRPVTAARRRSVGLFVQDDWRVSPRLTLNLGIRYDYFAPQWEANGLQYNFDPKTGNLVVPDEQSLKNLDPAWPLAKYPVVTASSAGFPSRMVNSDGNNFYPRIGFAYRPFNNQNTVVRGGYGVYIVPDQMTGANGNSLLMNGGPFALSSTFNNSVVNGAPLLQWPVGFPTAGTTYNGVPSVSGVNPSFRYPYTQQWNLTVEHQVLGQGLRLSYIGTKDTDLGWSRDLNVPPPSTAPFDPTRRAYPFYSSVAYIDNGANAYYHSFEANLTFRRVFGFTGQAGYAFAKQISDAGDSYNTLAGSSVQNPYCRACDRGATSLVAPQRVFIEMNWQIPYGRQQKYGSSINPVLNQVLGGWQVTMSYRAHTGQYFTPTYSGADPANVNVFSGRPDVIGNPVLPEGQRSPDHWYNEAAFAIPAPNSGRFGNLGRNTVQGPGFQFMDFALFKAFPIHERARLLFSMVALNFLNHPNWSGIGNGINSANPGFISGLTGAASTYGFAGPMRGISLNAGIEF